MTSHPHLDADLLYRLLMADLEPEQGWTLLRHLLATCPTCLAAFRERFHLGELASIAAPENPWWDVDVSAERAEAPRRVAELEALPYGERLRRAGSDPALATWGVLEALLAACRAAWSGTPQRALELAVVAETVAGRIPQERYPKEWVADRKALAWAYLGNVRRILAELPAAEECFALAHHELDAGTGEEGVLAEVLDLEASLRRFQHRFEEAVGLADRAASLYRAAGEPHLAGKVLVKKAMTQAEAGEGKGAIDDSRRALELLDPERDPRLQFVVRHNLVFQLHLGGRRAEAAALLPLVQAQAPALGTALDRLRLRWIEASLAADDGRGAEAEAGFLAVREGMAEHALWYDVARVSLDLAALYLEQGRTGEVQRLAAEMLPVFESREIHREAIAALMLFARAAAAEAADAALARTVAAYLDRARNRPGLVFEPPAAPA